MELTNIFNAIENHLKNTNEELGFKKSDAANSSLAFKSDSGSYRLVYDDDSNILAFECAYDVDGSTSEFNTVSRLLLEPENVDDREVRSLSNEIIEEVERLFKTNKKVNLEKVKMPKAVSRTKAKNGLISYDVDSLANRFGALYPDFKDTIKQNIVDYGEFLPETFFAEYGNERVLSVIKNGSDAERKKLFKLLNEIFEDGTNEVQDIIAAAVLHQISVCGDAHFYLSVFFFLRAFYNLVKVYLLDGEIKRILFRCLYHIMRKLLVYILGLCS